MVSSKINSALRLCASTFWKRNTWWKQLDRRALLQCRHSNCLPKWLASFCASWVNGKSTKQRMIYLCLMSDYSVSQPFENAKLVQLVQAYSKIYPQLNEPPSSTPNPKSAADGDGDSERSYAPEVEETVRRYFERLYTTEANPSRFASLLNTCRNSSDQKQLDFFSCTVHTLVSPSPSNPVISTHKFAALFP